MKSQSLNNYFQDKTFSHKTSKIVSRHIFDHVARRLKEQNIPEHLKNGSVNSAHVVIPISGPPPVCSYTGPWVFLWIKAAQITLG